MRLSNPLLMILIAVFAAILFIPGIGSAHLFDWDEINFAECAREMVVTGNYAHVTINYIPFWEKPPVFIWLQALSMNIFGVNEFAARFPDAICGVLTLLILFRIGKRLYDASFGLMWALVYAGSILPHFYFKSAIIDPWFNLFIFLGIYYFIVYVNERTQATSSGRVSNIIASAFFIGIAVLTKGPVALLVFGLVAFVHFALGRFRVYFEWKHVFIYLAVVISVGGLWFLMLLFSGHPEVIAEFFAYQVRLFQTEDASHGGPFIYHWIILLAGCFPASIFCIAAFQSKSTDTPFRVIFKKWMSILLLTVLILFSIVKTKIVHYSSLCYFPLTFLATWYIWWYFQSGVKWKKWMTPALSVIGILLSIAFISVTFIEKFKFNLIKGGFIKDPFAEANLQASPGWTGFEFIAGAFLLMGVIVFLWLVQKDMRKTPVVALFIFTLICVNLATLLLPPRVEEYSQRAAVDFYKSKAAETCYIETIGFKSFAHLFYGQVKLNPLKDPDFISYCKARGINSFKEADEHALVEDWLLKGKVSFPVYYVSKINREDEIRNNYPFLKEISRKNGFIFFTRSSQ